MNTALHANDLDIDLSRFDRPVATETNAPRSRSQFAEQPDGKYEVRIEDVELYKSPNSGNPVLKYTMRILGPTHVNQLMWKRRGITEKTRDWVLDELKVCGLELEKFSDLKYHLHDLIGVELEVTRKTKGEDTTIFFNGPVGNANRQDDDDELPF